MFTEGRLVDHRIFQEICHLPAFITEYLFVFLLHNRAADCFGCSANNERIAYLWILGHDCGIFGATSHNGTLPYFYDIMLWNSSFDVCCICCSDSGSYICWIYCCWRLVNVIYTFKYEFCMSLPMWHVFACDFIKSQGDTWRSLLK